MIVPRLSVTVLNYNYARFLPDCLQSILSQTYRDFEVIIVDDCSKDDSVAVIEPFLKDERVRLVRHEKNSGYVRALLEGTEELSRGAFVSVISADDMALRNDAFERQMALLEANESMGFCFSGFAKVIDGASAPAEHRSFESDRTIPGHDLFRLLTAGTAVAVLHTGTILRASSYRAVGGYGRDLRYAPDTDMWLKLCLEGSVGYVADALYGYRIHASQMSGIGAHKTQMIETIRILERACDDAARRGMDVSDVRNRGVKTFLFGAAMDEVFRGHERIALQRCGVALSLRPWDTITARDAWIVAARAVLGQKGFGLARSTGRSIKALLR